MMKHLNKKIVFLIAILIPLSIAIPLVIPRTITIESVGVHGKEREAQVSAINKYFQSKGMPLAGYGEKMVSEAEKNGIDWRLLPAIAVRESSGGLQACGFNPFGWNSCKGEIGKFESWDEAIEIVARNLGGNNPNTAHFYGGKDVRGILTTYNPPSIVKTYADEVIRIMDQIGQQQSKTP